MARQGFSGHRKFKRFAQMIGDELAARGMVEFLWETAYEAGNDLIGDAVDVELACRWRGEPGKVVQALLACGGEGNVGLIEPDPTRPGQFLVHDLFDHAPDYVSRRATREAERAAKGQSISEMRRAAGLKGSQIRHSKTPETPEPSNGMANGGHLPIEVKQTVSKSLNSPES